MRWTAESAQTALPGNERAEFIVRGKLPRHAGRAVVQGAADLRHRQRRLGAGAGKRRSTEGLESPAARLDVLAPGVAAVDVRDAWIRASVPGQSGTGAFMKLNAPSGARLVGASTPAAGVAEVHEMKMEGDTMRMRAAGGARPAGAADRRTQAGRLSPDADGPEAAAGQGRTVPLTLRSRTPRAGRARGTERAGPRGCGRTGRRQSTSTERAAKAALLGVSCPDKNHLPETAHERQSKPFAFSQFVPGFDFLQNLAERRCLAGASAVPGMPSLSSWVAPTLSVEEVDKRIQELKTVQYWLEQNGHALKATIQALEVQKMTLSTLRGMNVRMEDLASAFTRTAAASATASAPTAASAAPAPSHRAAAPEPSRMWKKTTEDAEADEPSAAKSKPANAAGAAADGAGVVDPLQWWGALTQQFQQIAGFGAAGRRRS